MIYLIFPVPCGFPFPQRMPFPWADLCIVSNKRVIVYSAVRKLDRRTFLMSDQLPAWFAQLSGIVYYKNNASATRTLSQTLTHPISP